MEFAKQEPCTEVCTIEFKIPICAFINNLTEYTKFCSRFERSFGFFAVARTNIKFLTKEYCNNKDNLTTNRYLLPVNILGTREHLDTLCNSPEALVSRNILQITSLQMRIDKVPFEQQLIEFIHSSIDSNHYNNKLDIVAGTIIHPLPMIGAMFKPMKDYIDAAVIYEHYIMFRGDINKIHIIIDNKQKQRLQKYKNNLIKAANICVQRGFITAARFSD